MDYKLVENYSNYIIFKTGKIYNKKIKRFIEGWKQIDKRDGRIDIRLGLSKDGKRKKFLLARLLGFAFIYNDDPINKTQIDHIDRNPLNNDLSNLRWATIEEQQRNRGLQKNNKLGLRYICKRKDTGKYRVQLKIYKYYKTFKTLEEAILNRNMFLEYMGEDYLNIDE